MDTKLTVFVCTTYHFQGSWVANVVAHDQTADEGTIKYSIFSGNENEAFTINPITGENCIVTIII